VRARAAAIALLIALAAPAANAADDPVAQAARDFYAVAQKAESGLPDAKTRDKLRPLITPALAALLDKASAAEDAFVAANKDSPPLVEGDLYSSLFEGVTSFTVGVCTTSGKTARCPVALIYDDKNPSGATRWTDTLYLADTSAGWKVDDIGYGGTWAFGNKGRMTDTLKATIRDVSN